MKFCDTPAFELIKLEPIFKENHTPSMSFSYCDYFKSSYKKSQPIHDTFNKMNRYFIQQGVGHLYNEQSISYNGSKSEKYTRVEMARIWELFSIQYFQKN